MAATTVTRLREHYSAQLLAAFTANGGPLHESAKPGGPPILLAFARALEAVAPVLTQRASWDPQIWRHGIGRLAIQQGWRTARPGLECALIGGVNAAQAASMRVPKGGFSINRRDVRDLGRVPKVDPTHLFVAVMAWGTGTTGYGWWRTANIAYQAGSLATFRIRLSGQIAAARNGVSAGAMGDAVWDAWSRAFKLSYFGSAFASKLAYFAGADNTGFGPLIADRRTAWAVWALAEDLGFTRTRKRRYVSYVRSLSQWASNVGLRPDSLERALFELGPSVISGQS